MPAARFPIVRSHAALHVVEDTMMAQPRQYYVRLRGKIAGPVTLKRLQDLAAQGKLRRHHEVSLDRQTWRPAGDVPEIFPPEAGPEPARAESAAERAPQRAERPQQAAPGPVPGEQWYYSIDGSVEGPVPTDAIGQLIQQGRLRPTDYVSPLSNPTGWQLVQDSETFSHLLRAHAPAAGPAATTPYYGPQQPAYGAEAYYGQQQPEQYYGGAEAPQESAQGLAITSMILSFFTPCCLGVPGLVSLILGIAALAKMRRIGNPAGKGMAIAGVIISVIFLLAIVVLVIMALAGVGGIAEAIREAAEEARRAY